jgi:hypothetical protein
MLVDEGLSQLNVREEACLRQREKKRERRELIDVGDEGTDGHVDVVTRPEP